MENNKKKKKKFFLYKKYYSLAVVNWIFEFNGSFTAFIVPTITLTCSALAYGIATFKNEERVTSSLTGTSNFIDLATQV